jgi:hypothetical protein
LVAGWLNIAYQRYNSVCLAKIKETEAKDLTNKIAPLQLAQNDIDTKYQ